MASLTSKLLSFFRKLSGRGKQQIDAPAKTETALPLAPPARSSVQPPASVPDQNALKKVETPTEPRATTGSLKGQQIRPPRPPPAISKPTVDLVIGFDFGTSCSKVVISDQILDRSYAVAFRPNANGIERYLQPTIFFTHASGTSFEDGGGGELQTNLKLRLIKAVESKLGVENAIASVAMYMGLVLRKTVDWFNSRLLNLYRDKEICWALNVGFPGKQVEPGPLLDAYTAAAKAACRCLAGKEPISISLIRNLLAQPLTTESSEHLILPERVSFYPEIAAQLAGYVKSPFHRVGPLLLVDVGAGTLDVSTLILHTYGQEDVCSFHFCEVALKGAFHLFQARIDGLNQEAPERVRYKSLSDITDPSAPIPDALTEYLAPGERVTDHLHRRIQKVDSEFIEDCRSVCRKNIVAFKAACQEVHAQGRKYHPFKTSLQFILSGGGSRLRFYRELLGKEFEQSLIAFTPWESESTRRTSLGQGLQRVSFEVPRDLKSDISQKDFDRLSVAHGLAYGADNLMKVTGNGKMEIEVKRYG